MGTKVELTDTQNMLLMSITATNENGQGWVYPSSETEFWEELVRDLRQLIDLGLVEQRGKDLFRVEP